MAKDLELEKTSPDDSSDKAKKSKDKKPAKKKKGIVKYFKDARSEFKKVVWPTPKETTHNTIVVLVMCAIAAVLIFGIDSLFGLLNGLLFH
ncbi:MAG: preprotein translocase subunit SecE [Ruminococcaceae bacterium]|nr:preprotein translocase subunit SecE [Oscillospiraceae bacterium]